MLDQILPPRDNQNFSLPNFYSMKVYASILTNEYPPNDLILTMDVKDKDITEVHIVGGVHPKMGLHYFANLIENVKKIPFK